MLEIQGSYVFLSFLVGGIISSVFLCKLLSLLFKNRANSSLLLPPSPRALPIIGHLHLLLPIPHQALHKISLIHGSLIHLYLGSVPCVVASSPETAKEFLKTHESSFLNRPNTAAVDFLTYGSQDFSFAPYGTYWKFMKKLCMSELLGGRTLDILYPVRREEIKYFVEFLLEKAKSLEEVNIEAELIRVTNNVISRMLMSTRCSMNSDESAGDIRKLVQETAELTGRFNLSDYLWFCKNLDLQGLKKRLRDVHQRFDELMERIIEEHQENRHGEENQKHDGDVKDLLDILLDISEDENSDIKLTRQNIKAFLLDIFAAGTETSAITVEWALAELINHPSIMKKAIEEIDSVTGKTRLVEESDISKLHYLQAIVKETLRLHPTGPIIVRESNEECTVNGYKIPEKTRVFVNVWAIGRYPNHWENPLEFHPERFMCGGIKSQIDVRGQQFEFLPFGSGRRGCPGTSLALQVVQTTLATMIQCFEWKLKNKVKNGKVDMEEGLGITLPRANPLICVPVVRFNPFTAI